MLSLLMLCGGAALLYYGAEWLVGGASGLAAAAGVPQLLVGLTVVAYGTSAPEIVVGMQAAATGHGEIALGNVLGSNIANIGLILGVTALVEPPRVQGHLRVRELPMMLGAALLIPALLANGGISRLDGALLWSGALLYTVWMIRGARAGASVEAAAAISNAADEAGAPTARTRPAMAMTALAGLALLVAGGSLFVEGASQLALAWGMSERLVGLTIVAVGTSLPELATSVLAARRGHADIAVGNVVGSNIFNVLLCLGGAGVVGGLQAPVASVASDVVVMVALTAVAGVMMRTERHISRVEGTVLLTGYAAYLTSLAIG